MKFKTVRIYLRDESVEVFNTVSEIDVSEGIYVTITEACGSQYLFPHSQIKYIAVQPN